MHDAAEVQIVGAKRADMPAEVQHMLAEVSLRAARRAGELLAATPLPHGGRPAKKGVAKQSKTLRELGLNKNQSSRWRRLAANPVELFEGQLAECRRSGMPPSAAKLLRLAEELARGRRSTRSKAPPRSAMPEQPVSASAPPAGMDDDLVELQKHLEHFGDVFHSLVDNSHQQAATKRHAATVLKEMQGIVAKLRGASAP